MARETVEYQEGIKYIWYEKYVIMGKEKKERKTKMYLLSPILRNYQESTTTGSFSC